MFTYTPFTQCEFEEWATKYDINTQHRANLAKYSLLIPTVLVTLKKYDMSGSSTRRLRRKDTSTLRLMPVLGEKKEF